MKSAARLAAVAVACFGLSMLAMYADTWWVPNPVATDLAAFIFIPWGLTFLWSLLAFANLAACTYATVKASISHPAPDYRRIAELEAVVFGDDGYDATWAAEEAGTRCD